MTIQPIELKIAYIGGGSREWARKLMMDLALCPDLTGQVALYDIDLESARLNERLGNWLQDQPGVLSRWSYCVEPKLDEALRGADFVVLSIQPGSLEYMAQDIAIAERYGLYFPVGDTTGAPGLMRGVRAAIIYADFAHHLATVCPSAWIINYTNPMAICTRTLTRVEPKLKAFGCCHEVFNTQKGLAELANKYLGVTPKRQEIRVNVIGTNHFTWFDRASYQDTDLLDLVRQHIDKTDALQPLTRAEVEGWGNYFKSGNRVKLTLFQRYGLLAAAGDRHLVEFLPGFTQSPETLFEWGVGRTPVAFRIERSRAAPQKTRDLMEGRAPLTLDASGEEGVAQMRAILGLGDLTTNVNLENRGQIPNLPLGAVVETNAQFSRDQVHPLTAGSLPDGLHGLISRHVANQEMIVDAALSRDKDLAFHAVYNDPTNHLPIDRSWDMFEEMFSASRGFWESEK